MKTLDDIPSHPRFQLERYRELWIQLKEQGSVEITLSGIATPDSILKSIAAIKRQDIEWLKESIAEHGLPLITYAIINPDNPLKVMLKLGTRKDTSPKQFINTPTLRRFLKFRDKC